MSKLEPPLRPPTRVRAIIRGVVYPLDDTIAYLGFKDDQHCWAAYGPKHERFRQAEFVLKIGELPGHTMIGVPVGPLVEQPEIYRFLLPGEAEL